MFDDLIFDNKSNVCYSVKKIQTVDEVVSDLSRLLLMCLSQLPLDPHMYDCVEEAIINFLLEATNNSSIKSFDMVREPRTLFKINITRW